MSNLIRKSAPAEAAGAPIPEHARVRAVREIREGDAVAPAGARGTVVHVIGDGGAYDVEFTWPNHVVLSAARAELEVL